MTNRIVVPLRTTDKWGDGSYKSPRGKRKHNGIDMACYKDSLLISSVDGTITKYGYPYNPNNEKKGHLRYIQITDGQGRDHRYFYVSLLDKKVGDPISKGEVFGKTQGLQEVYPDITDHYHYEVKRGSEYLNPHLFLETGD